MVFYMHSHDLCSFKAQLEELDQVGVFTEEQSSVFTQLEGDIEELEEQVNKLLM